MSSNYEYDLLGTRPLHTRYSELVQISSPASARRVAWRRLQRAGLNTPHIKFGQVRHRMFDRESKSSGKLPTIITENLDLPEWVKQAAIETEVYMTAKVYGAGVIHATLDALIREGGIILDYKTTKRGVRPFLPSTQLVVYAVVCQANGIDVRGAYLIAEIWNDDKTQIEGYESDCYTIDDKLLTLGKKWLRKRASLLREALEELKPLKV